MSRKALSRIWPLGLAIATAVIAFEATTVRGQIEWAEDPDAVFDTPMTSPGTNKVRQADSTTNPDQINRPGTFNLIQTGGASATTGTRTPIPGTEPKFTSNAKIAAPRGKKPVSAPQNAQQTIPQNAPQIGQQTAQPMIPPSPATSSEATQASSTSPVRQANQAAMPSATRPTANSQSAMPSAAPALASPNSSKRVTAAAYGPTDVVDRDGGDVSARVPRRIPMPVVVTTNPHEQPGTPGVRGALFGLTGLTATERLYQLQTQMAELARENEELRRENGAMISRLKESQDQLLAGAREIQLARKELSSARVDLDRLRGDLQTLREKVRLAEKEHSAVLQTIGPILQQLLESDDLSSLPPNPAERD